MFIDHEAVPPLEFDGLRIADYTAGRDTSSSFAEITLPPGVRHKVSWSRRSDKFYYVVSGAIEFVLDEQTRRMSAGDVCVVPQGVRFSYSNASLTEAKLILVHTPHFKLECEVFE